VSDSCGNELTGQTYSNSGSDQTAPSITFCPPDTSINCVNADTSTTSLGLPVASDNCGSVSVTYSDNVIFYSCAGNYAFNRTFYVTDDCGNVDSCTQLVEVYDTLMVTCPPDTNVCANEPAFALSGASPAGGTYSGTGVSNNIFDPAVAGPGAHIITYTYTEDYCCTHTCTSTIFVDTVPVMDCPADFSVCKDEAPFALNASPAGGTFSGTGVSGGQFNPNSAGTGTHTITYTFTDGNGCSNSCTFNITVKPVPEMLCPPNMEVCINDAVFTLTGAMPVGSTYSGPGVSLGKFNPAVAGLGVHTITVSFTNSVGCSNNCQFTITVNDTTPVICPVDTAVCANDADFLLSGASPSGGVYSGTAVTAGMFSPATAGPGVHTITYTYTNGDNCESVCTFDITVDTVPVMTCPQDMSVCVDGNSVDILGGLPAGGVYSGTGVNAGQFDPLSAGIGLHTITYTYTDGNGCSNSCDFEITVDTAVVVVCQLDDTVCVDDPDFELLGGMPAGGTYAGTGVTNNGGVYSFSPATVGVGVYTLTYTYADQNGCSNSCDFTIMVKDLPAVECPLDMEMCVDANPMTLTGASPSGGMYSGTGVSGGIFDPAVAGVGTHTITYTYTDAFGCVNSCTFDITVNALPVLTCPADTAVCVDATSFLLDGAMPAGGTYSGSGIMQGGYFDPAYAGVGVHTITYSYADNNQCGNSCTFTIEVFALPQVSCPMDTAVCVDADPFTLAGGLPMGGVYSGSGVTAGVFDPAQAQLGSNLITYNYTDANGCSSSCTFTVTVNDLPVVECPQDFSVCADDPAFQLGGVSPTGGVFSGAGVNNGMFNPAIAGGGVHLITYTYTDAFACVNSCTFEISVGPIVDAGLDTTIYLCNSYTFDAMVSGPPTLQYTWTPALTLDDPTILNPTSTPIEPTMFTLTVVDGNGCSNSDSFFLNVLPSGNSFSGSVVYDNDPKTALPDFAIILQNLDSNTVDTIYTANNGLFCISGLAPGTYTVGGYSDQVWAWGGVNATDALAVTRHFVELDTLRGLRLIVGDVNAQFGPTATDAFLIAQRFAGLINTFVIPDWVMERDTILFSSDVLYTRQYLALVSGDVNGSHIPYVKVSPQGSLTSEGEIQFAPGAEARIPVSIVDPAILGATSLQLSVPAGWTIHDVVLNPALGGELVFKQEGKMLNIAWFSLDAPYAQAGSMLFEIVASPARNAESVFHLGNVLEVSDPDANVIKEARLAMPRMLNGGANVQVSTYPNPFTQESVIEYVLPERGEVVLEVFNVYGAVVARMSSKTQEAGVHQFTVDGSQLVPGTYHYTLRFDDGSRASSVSGKLVKMN
jgi:hypothetical protein